MKSLKILILEDVAEDVMLIERVLKKDGINFSSLRADTKEEFIEGMNTFDPDVILSDHGMPQFNSVEALTLCKQKHNEIPFILVTGTVSEEFAVTILKLGADDYILKSNLSRLPTAIRNSIRHRDIENERTKAKDSMFAQNAELVKVNRELDSFVYNSSHNLRAPLSSLLGLISLAQEQTTIGPELSNYFEMMNTSVKKLDATLKAILDYSRNSRDVIKTDKIDFEALVLKSFHELEYVGGQEKINESIKVNGEAYFFSDIKRLSTLLNNVLSNSVRYRDASKPNQYINVLATITNSLVTIVVEDNGIGIEESQLPKIGDMFHRATELSNGAGLGLYIAKEIVHALNGEIIIQSKINEGTTVTFSIPNLHTSSDADVHNATM